MSPLSCTGLGFLLISFSVPVEGSEAPIPRLVTEAACPGTDEPPFRDPEELAAEVCRDGRVAACGAVGASVDESKLTGWLTEACQAGKQDACAFLEGQPDQPTAAP